MTVPDNPTYPEPRETAVSPLDQRIRTFADRLDRLSRSTALTLESRRELQEVAKEFLAIVRDLSTKVDEPPRRPTKLKGSGRPAVNRRPGGPTRVCGKCKEEKPIEDFAVRTDVGTRRGTCIDCYRDGQHQRYLSVERSKRLGPLLRFVLDGDDPCSGGRCSICTRRFEAGEELTAYDLELAHSTCWDAANDS